jgi:diguanylate cyclase (GGDEF)-like protein
LADTSQVTSGQPGGDATSREDALDAAVAADLPVVMSVLAAVLVVTAGLGAADQQGTTRLTFAVLAIAGLAGLGAAALAARRGAVPAHWAHPVTAAALLVAAAAGIAQLVFTADPRHTSTLVLVVFGAGLCLLSVRWLTGVLYLLLGGWVTTVLGLDLLADVLHEGIALALATLAAGLAGAVRRRDVVKAAEARAQAEAAAVRDDLTGLANRRGLVLLGEQILETARRQGDAMHCLVVSIAGFRDVGERLGRGPAEELLVAVADSLRSVTRATDVVARWHGEEFCVVGPGPGISAVELERRVVESLTAVPPVDRRVWHPRLDVGSAVLAPWDGGDLAAVIGQADEAMSQRRALRRFAEHRSTPGVAAPGADTALP